MIAAFNKCLIIGSLGYTIQVRLCFLLAIQFYSIHGGGEGGGGLGGGEEGGGGLGGGGEGGGGSGGGGPKGAKGE